MKRNIIRTCVLGLGLLTLASCEDPMDELTSLLYDRVFSPIDFEARNITENSVNLQWVSPCTYPAPGERSAVVLSVIGVYALP